MGAGAATMKGTLDEEVKKPIDATDVDTPRGVSVSLLLLYIQHFKRYILYLYPVVLGERGG